MISSEDFDHFLKHGHIQQLEPGTPMQVLLSKYGEEYWTVKSTEQNGLIYGIIKVGCIEFHIYNEKISGVSYRPDISFDESDFEGVTMPWIVENKALHAVEKTLNDKAIAYKKYVIAMEVDWFEIGGDSFFKDPDVDLTVMETEGGVGFLFDTNTQTNALEAYQICRYY